MSRTPLPVENPPKSLTIEPYSKQNRQWPRSGPTILAQYDDDTIVVYVETSKLVAAHAVKKQHGFRRRFEPLRVYTSFIRSQAHFEWNSKFDSPEKLKEQQKILRIRQQQEEEQANRFKKKKKKQNRAKDNDDNDDNADKDDLNNYPQQRHTLAVRIRRSTFDQWIETASLEDSDDRLNAGDDFDDNGLYIGWRFVQSYMENWQPWWVGRYHNNVVYRWVNDTYPVLPLNGAAPHQRLARKSLELFLCRNAATVLTSPKTVLSVEDITPFVNEIRARLTNHKQGNVKDIWSPSERPYIPSADRILE
ncbi:hypothetical protein BCR42DRAFT_65196 [Absidia repens]|uniref:Uncharacterized protein n=1 Tax=Absidia repens TaxID=90262 RepID=A0A1X2IBN7_9FUNG|nr:hypothetical protein BCR42DRAFT_65196 [Absidia repens]